MIMSNPYEGERRAGSVGSAAAGRVGADRRRRRPGPRRRRSRRSTDSLAASLLRVLASPDATAAAFDDGWFKTGDLGVRAPDGYYTLRGRRGDLIISGGFNIYPREIEELLLEDRRVREAAVVGIPDDVRGEVPVAYVVADEALT